MAIRRDNPDVNFDYCRTYCTGLDPLRTCFRFRESHLIIDSLDTFREFDDRFKLGELVGSFGN
jgi:hypothetical protein